jgi:hypothetical protein
MNRDGHMEHAHAREDRHTRNSITGTRRRACQNTCEFTDERVSNHREQKVPEPDSHTEDNPTHSLDHGNRLT